MPGRGVSEEKVKGRGVGRPDYTKGVFSRSQPIVRRWQTRIASYNIQETDTLEPGEMLLSLQRPREPGYLMALYDAQQAINPPVLMRSYVGVVEFDKFYYSSRTEAALLYYTTHGPYLEQWVYGEADFHFLTPMTYVPEDEWEYMYIFNIPIHDTSQDFTFDHTFLWFDDVIV